MTRGYSCFFVLLLSACTDGNLIDVTNDGSVDLEIDTKSDPGQDMSIDLTVDDEAAPLDDDTPCSDAKRLTLVAGHAEATGDTSNHQPEPFDVICDDRWSFAGGPLRMDGPQAYFVFTGKKDRYYRVRVTADFENANVERGGPALYVFTNSNCTAETITENCSSKGLYGKLAGSAGPQSTALVYKARWDGDIFVAVDSFLVDQSGPFTLEVDAIYQPANRECSNATWLTFSNGRAVAEGGVGDLLTPNDLGAIDCINGKFNYRFEDGDPQVFYRFDAKPNKVYEITVRRTNFGLRGFYVVSDTACALSSIQPGCRSGGQTGNFDVSAASGTAYAGVWSGFHYQPDQPGPQLISIFGGISFIEYELEVIEQDPLPHSRCAAAEKLEFDSWGELTLSTTTTGATNEYGLAVSCEIDKPLAGPQLYYALDLKEGVTYKIRATGILNEGYLFPAAACGDPNEISHHCSGQGSGFHFSGFENHFTPQQTGTYILALDSTAVHDHGSVNLHIRPL